MKVEEIEAYRSKYVDVAVACLGMSSFVPLLQFNPIQFSCW